MDEILHKRIHGLKHSICLSLELYFPPCSDTIPPRPAGTRQEPHRNRVTYHQIYKQKSIFYLIRISVLVMA